MSTEPSPRPWRVNGHSIEANDPDGLWLQNEKTGWGVVANLPSCPKSRMSKRNRETWDAIVDVNARLIVDAVNQHDRLRGIVRRLLDAVDALYTVAAPGAIVKELTPDRMCLDVPIGKIVADARAAIGEAAP